MRIANEYKIEYYKTKAGKVPVKDFINSLDKNMKAKEEKKKGSDE